MAIQPALILPHGLPLRRMLIALCASLLVHFLLAGGWGSGKGSTTSAVVPLQARLEMIPAGLPPLVVADVPRVTTAAQPVISTRRASPAAVSAAAVEPLPAEAAGGGPDLRFYLARELDRYPSPLSVLNLDNGRGTAGSARLWVSIDQAGQVVDAAVIDAEPPGEFERLARDRVLATRFVPAQRDGRAVKSRVLLVLRQDG